MAITYEWVVETFDKDDPNKDDPEIVDTNAYDTYPEALKAAHQEDTLGWRICLTRNVGNDVDGLQDRLWAYIDYTTLTLPEYFEVGGGEPSNVPVAKRHRKEIERRHSASYGTRVRRGWL